MGKNAGLIMRKEGEYMVSGSFFSRLNGTRKAVAVLLAAGMIFTGCAGGGNEEESAVALQKDGKVKALIVESFDKANYDKDELQQRILREASDYNAQSGQTAISVEKVAVSEGKVRVEMTYEDAAAYASFNGGTFFIGSVQKAGEDGYDLNRVLSSVKDDLETVGKSDIANMTDMRLLITDMREPVTLNGKAAYISANVTVDKKGKTVFFNEDSEELAYILFK